MKLEKSGASKLEREAYGDQSHIFLQRAGSRDGAQ